MDVIVPVGTFDLDPKGTPRMDHGDGLGDVRVGSYIQWDPSLDNDDPVVMDSNIGFLLQPR